MPEFDLIQHIQRSNDRLRSLVRIPPGDDMAMIEAGGRLILAAVDQVVEGRHFTRASATWAEVGRKAMARSVSDVAAMAAVPLAGLAAVTLPRGFAESDATAMFDAVREAGERWGCPVIGGDIAFHAAADAPTVCAVTVLAEPLGPDLPPVRRSGAQAGDGVYVTGRVGGSLDADGGGRHLSFTPRVKEAQRLRRALRDRLHAMIDVSDGLGRDAAHLARAAELKIELDAEAIPRADGRDWREAVASGEDYELLFAAEGEVPRAVGDLPITRIGRVMTARDAIEAGDEARGAWVVARAGEEVVPVDEAGWEHGS